MKKNRTNGIRHRKLNEEPQNSNLPGILFITSSPPRECGIATFSQDLTQAINNKFIDTFGVYFCPIESDTEQYTYEQKIICSFNTDHPETFDLLAKIINSDSNISLVVVQHEFGFFEQIQAEFNNFLNALNKPFVLVFHTVLPSPEASFKKNVCQISDKAARIIVMTNASSEILIKDYSISKEKINVIPHGTHLVKFLDKRTLKAKIDIQDRTILATFGLISRGKSIETTLYALPEIVRQFPNVIFLIIGKTLPTVVKQEGESYREFLEDIVCKLHVEQHVMFINQYLPIDELLEYLQMTDIYLFTSKDPLQAVSGTFSYAMSCGCPIVSTPIPHAKEVLNGNSGITIEFCHSGQLSVAVIKLLSDEKLRESIRTCGLQKMEITTWENVAISYAKLFKEILSQPNTLKYRIPPINLSHLKRMTDTFGMFQFSKINVPDTASGYTLDDNARAMIVFCQHYELTRDEIDLDYIHTYLIFIDYCLQSEGHFLNYVNKEKKFTEQNFTTNLADANGRTLWALGYLISLGEILPDEILEHGQRLFKDGVRNFDRIQSPRAMAFAIKGLYFKNQYDFSSQSNSLIIVLANRLVQMYRHESDEKWFWFESYITYANSILPEALLYAWLSTKDVHYKTIAKESFDFLLSKTYLKKHIRMISNKNWLSKENYLENSVGGGEQPIDVAYTILALEQFYNTFKLKEYRDKIAFTFNWYLGLNSLDRIVYNPCTGGCYDGLEEHGVNLNQGAESTICYAMARMVIEKLHKTSDKYQFNFSSNTAKAIQQPELTTVFI